MSNGNVLIGTTDRSVLYCGHRVWGRYTNANGRQIEPGGSVMVREEWVDREGEPAHAVREYRIDPDANVEALGKVLRDVACGEPITLVINAYESARGTQWRNVFDVVSGGEPFPVDKP